MSVSFNAIPIDIRTPGQYIEIDNSRAVQGLPVIRHKILVIGQRLTAGTVAQGVPTRITSKGQAEACFGRGSMLSSMFNALKEANNYTESWGLALDDAGAGVAATGTVAFGGTVTAAGTLCLYIGGKAVKVAITAAQVTTAIATAVAAAINADTSLPVTATAATSTVTMTARHKGICGNYIDVRTNYYQGEKLPAGLTATITAMASGATNPDIATAITAMGDEQYHTIIMPYTDAANLAALETEMARRFGPMVQKEGHAFAAVNGTHAAASTLGDSRNSPHLTIMGCQNSPTNPCCVAAVVGAVDAYEPDPARPRQTLTLTGVLPPVENARYTLSERNIHLYDVISTYIIDAGGNCLIERLITTYKTNALGVDDISYLDIETMRTVAYLRYSVRSRIALKFPRYKLASDGTNFGPGQAIVTPKVIRAELVALFQQWELAGLVEGIDQFKRDLIVERNTSDPNRVDAVIPPDVVNQFRVFAAAVQFRL
jgi:phage tail sheath gpL-like